MQLLRKTKKKNMQKLHKSLAFFHNNGYNIVEAVLL